MKRFFFLFFSFLMLHAHSQEMLATVHFDGKVGFMKGSSFQKFVTTYNALNNTNKTKLKNFGAASGYSFGADMIMNGIYYGYYQHRVSATASSQVNDYSTREFILKQNTYGADFGGGKITKNFGILGFFGIYVANANIIADIKYRDGYRSYGTEGALNGIYNAFGFSGCLGMKAYQFIGPIGITAAVRWCTIFGSDTFEDFGIDKQLPEDWGAYYSGGSLDYKGKYVAVHFQSVYIDLGIALKLFSTYK